MLLAEAGDIGTKNKAFSELLLYYYCTTHFCAQNEMKKKGHS